ncbi:MAG: hypothetical protein QOJ64_3447 [Acidobacteriota bacterium]|jgi:ankyrin repeat protein|nr:hypothetical protein [Acidobacteriota bacterium]
MKRLFILNLVFLLSAGCAQPSNKSASTSEANVIASPIATNSDGQDATKQVSNDPLIDALMSNDQAKAKSLINQGADLKAKDKNGWTPLMFAAAYAKPAPEMLDLLLAKGADVNAKDNSGDTTLTIAIVRHNTGLMDIMNVLLAKGADVNASNKQGLTPLMAAAAQHKLDAVQALLAKGANVNAKEGDGNTALMLSIREAADLPPDVPDNGVESLDKALTDMAQALFNKGADVNVKNKKGETALTIAKVWADHFGKQGLLQLLQAKR